MANLINGTDGGETINGTAGDDIIDAKGGNDTIMVSRGNDTVDGGAGTFDVLYTALDLPPLAYPDIARSLTVTNGLLSDSAGYIHTSFANIESVRFQDSTSNSVSLDASGFSGSGGIQFYTNGGTGNRTITGSAAGDYFSLGRGVNSVDGGLGNDVATALFNNSVGTLTLTQSGTTIMGKLAGTTVETLSNIESITFYGGQNAGVSIDASALVQGVTLAGSVASDTLVGGAGNDSFYITGGSSDADTYFGGSGADRFTLLSFHNTGMNGRITDFSDNDTIDLATVQSNESYKGTFIGSAAFSGVAGQYRTYVSGGKTYVSADGDGDGVGDQLVTLDGVFTLAEAGPGSNILKSTAAVITGTNNSDILTGTTASETINALDGSDTINATRGVDIVDGGGGYDTLYVDAGGNNLALGNVARTITLTTGRVQDNAGLLDTKFSNVETVYITDYSSNALTINGGSFTNVVGGFGNGFQAYLTGTGNRTITGSAYSDYIYLGSGTNWVDAGAGSDFVSIASSGQNGQIVATQSGATVTLSQNGATIDTILNAETVNFSSFNTAYGLNVNAAGVVQAVSFDTVTGRADVVAGGSGSDTFNIGSYNSGGTAGTDSDTITTGAGNDTLTVSYLTRLAGSTSVTDFSASDVLSLANVSFYDGFMPSFIGTAAFSNVVGQYRYASAGGQTVVQFDSDGNGTADRTITLTNGEFALVETGGGSNVLKIAVPVITGTNGSDTLTGTTANETINALDGGDTIYATRGTDIVDGGAGYDYLYVETGGSNLALGNVPRTITLTTGLVKDNAGYLNTSFSNVESIYLSDYSGNALTINGAGFTNVIGGSSYGFSASVSGTGNRTVTGSAYSDNIYLGSGINNVDAGAGYDYVSIALPNQSGQITVTQTASTLTFTQNGATIDTIANAETISLSPYNNAFGLRIDASGVSQAISFSTVGAQSDILVGGSGSDTFNVGNYSAGGTFGTDSDTITTGAGSDILYVSRLTTLAGSTIITDLSSSDTLNFSAVSYNESFVPSFIGTAAFSNAAVNIVIRRAAAKPRSSSTSMATVLPIARSRWRMAPLSWLKREAARTSSRSRCR